MGRFGCHLAISADIITTLIYALYLCRFQIFTSRGQRRLRNLRSGSGVLKGFVTFCLLCRMQNDLVSSKEDNKTNWQYGAYIFSAK